MNFAVYFSFKYVKLLGGEGEGHFIPGRFIPKPIHTQLNLYPGVSFPDNAFLKHFIPRTIRT